MKLYSADFTIKGKLKDLRSFASFIKKHNFTNKIVSAGNHDHCLKDERKKEAELILKFFGIQ